MNVDEIGPALAILRPALVGRKVTRILLDYSVTLEFLDKTPGAQIKLEQVFVFLPKGRAEVSIDPAHLGVNANYVAELFGATIADVGLQVDGTLEVAFEGGSGLLAHPNDHYESWSFVDDDGAQVISLTTSGGLAYLPARFD